MGRRHSSTRSRPCVRGQVRPDDGRQLLLHRPPGHRPWHGGEWRAAGPWDWGAERAWVVTPPPPPQLTVLNAGRRYLGLQDLAGKVFVTSGLGGMSGAQAKAAVIVGCIGVIAEVSPREQPPTPSRAPLTPSPSLLLPVPSQILPSQCGSPRQQTPLPSKCPSLPGPEPRSQDPRSQDPASLALGPWGPARRR